MTKTAYSRFNPNTSTSNTVSNGFAEDGYGTVVLTDENPTATDVAFCHYWGAHIAGWPNGFQMITVKNEKPEVATATARTSENGLIVEFEKGNKAGTTTIEVGFTITTLRTTANIASSDQTYAGFSGYLYYTVTNGDGTAADQNKPDAPNITNRDPLYVFIQCEENSNHNTISNMFVASRNGEEYIASDDDVVENTGTSQFPASTYPYKCPVSLNADYFVNLWNSNFSQSRGTHYLYETPKTIMFYYEAASGKWKCSTYDLVQFRDRSNKTQYGWLMKIKKVPQKPTELNVTDDIYVPSNGVDNGVLEIQWGYDNTPAVFALSNLQVITRAADPYADVSVTQRGNYIYVDVTGRESSGNKIGLVTLRYNASYNGEVYKVTETIRVHVYDAPSEELNAGASKTYDYTWGPNGAYFEMISRPEATGNVTVSDISTASNGTYKVTAGNAAGEGKVKSTYAWAQGNYEYGTGLRVDVRNFTVKGKDLSISKTPSKEYPVVGEKFSYTIEVSNPNSQEIKVNITDELNEKLDFVFVGDGGTYDKNTHTVTWTDVTVPANGSKSVTVYVKANAAGSIYNEAGVAWTGGSTSGNTTVTAKPSIYKLTYDANGGTIRADVTSATTMTDEISYIAGGHTFTVKTAPEANTGFNPTWAGHTLLGWADTADAKTAQYKAGDKIKLDEDTPTKTIYAVWQAPSTETKTVKIVKAFCGPSKEEVEAIKDKFSIDYTYMLNGNTTTGTLNGADAQFVTDPLFGDNEAVIAWDVSFTVNKGSTESQGSGTISFTERGKEITGWTWTGNGTGTGLTNRSLHAGTISIGLGNYYKAKEHTVTVNHLGDNGHNFWKGYDPTYRLQEGKIYDHSFDESMTALKYPKKSGVKSPKEFFIGEHHYVLDPMADNTPEDELKGEMGTENVVINLYYSLDVKGGNNPQKPDGGPDGIPDKYQAKIVYDADGKGTIEGKADKTEYKTIEKDGRMAVSGNVTISGATVVANNGQYCTGWEAKAKGDSNWSHDEIKGSTIQEETFAAKGNAVYTFTAQYIKAPTREEIPGILGSEFVTVDCVNMTIDPLHGDGKYGLISESAPDIAVGAVTMKNDEYTCEVTVNAAPYVAEYEKTNGSHALVDSTKTAATLTLKWNGTKWEPEESGKNTVTFKVRCGEPSANVNITKNYKYTLDGVVTEQTAGPDKIAVEIKGGKLTITAGNYTAYQGKTYEFKSATMKTQDGTESSFTDSTFEFGADTDKTYDVILNYELVEVSEKTVIIKYVNEDGEELDSETKRKGDDDPFRYGDEYETADWVEEGNTIDIGDDHYIIEKVEDPGNGKVTDDVTITVTCTKDNLIDPTAPGADPTDPDKKGDGIPDKYQVTITYQAVNGTVEGAGADGTHKIVVTLKNDDGDYATPGEGGKLTLTAAQIPGTTANTGYSNGVWDVEPNGAVITGDITFTITYSATTPTTPGPTPTTPPTGGGGTGGGTPDPTPTPVVPVPTAVTPVVPAAPAPAAAQTVTPVAATPVAAAPAAEAEGPAIEALEDEAVPLAAGGEEEAPELAALDDEEVPLAPGKGASWALINFALMNLAIFESLMLLIGYFAKTKNDDEERKLKKKGILRILSIPVAVISLIAFILTEDITLPTGFVDKYTIIMLIIAIVQTVVVALSNKKYEDEEEA